MWRIAEVHSTLQLWFSDGDPVNSRRGGIGVSSRLIVDKLGFLDITERPSAAMTVLSANGSLLKPGVGIGQTKGEKDACLELFLEIADGDFVIGLMKDKGHKPPQSGLQAIRGCFSGLNCFGSGFLTPNSIVAGRLKPLPGISATDIAFVNEMIALDYVPYQGETDAPGQSPTEITSLGKELFPFSPYGYQLALCIYDWTTASFARMVFLKIFQYAGSTQEQPLLDMPGIATSIWASNWGDFTPQDAEYMKSFMMKPASSLQDVEAQLHDVVDQLYQFSEIQNRLLAAAMQSLPRTSVLAVPHLYSGQPDISQFGLDQWCIEFEECPANQSPVGHPLKGDFRKALDTYMAKGRTITTKMVMSFTDRLEDALSYSNGILLVATPPTGADVWETAAYISPLSNDPKKNEYTFMPGARFRIQSVTENRINGRSMFVINIQPRE